MNAGHNRLRSFVQRVERLREEIDALNKDVSEIYKEARGEGWNVEAMKKVVAERQRMAKNPEKFNEINAVVELYRDALNCGTINATRVHAREPDSSNAASAPLPEAAQGGDAASLPASPPDNSNRSAGIDASVVTSPAGRGADESPALNSNLAGGNSAKAGSASSLHAATTVAPGTIPPGALTAAGIGGEGDGAHTPPRTPELSGEPDLPSFLDRRAQSGN